MKKFDITIEFIKSAYRCASVSAYDKEKSEITDKNKIVTRRHTITVVFSYPLRKAAVLSFRRKGGFRIRDIHKAICKGYQRIYKEEDDFIKKYPEKTSPYGIWGHDIGDLLIEEVVQTKPGRFVLYIGS